MTGTRPTLRALVLATSGGEDLARTLDALPSRVDEALVLDPLGRAGNTPVPRVLERDLAAALRAGWVLGLIEGEMVDPALAEALADAVAEPVPRPARMRLVHRGAGWELALRRPVPRLAAAGGFRVGIGGEATLALMPDGRLQGCLDGAIVMEHGELESALPRLDATAEALAALLPARRRSPGVLETAGAGMRAATAGLLGRAPRRLGWGRWIGSVLLGYRAVLIRAKCLERLGEGLE